MIWWGVQSMAESAGIAAIVFLGIRLGPVSFHARDDNNGRHCRDGCWHHYSCVLPHASIFTSCTDAPEVNEFFTLGFRAGSRRHIPSHMRWAQQVNQRTYTTHFSFPLLSFSFFFFLSPVSGYLCFVKFLPLSTLISQCTCFSATFLIQNTDVWCYQVQGHAEQQIGIIRIKMLSRPNTDFHTKPLVL